MENVTGYVETRLKLFKIEAREEMSAALARLIQASLVFFLVFTVITFVNIAVGIALGLVWGSYVWGFLAVAAFYLLLVLIVVIFGDRMGLKEKIYQYLGEPQNGKENE